MITAKEAAEVVASIEDSVTTSHLEKIEVAIRNAAQSGREECSVPFSINKKVLNVLEGLGYTVTIINDIREGIYTLVKW